MPRFVSQMLNEKNTTRLAQIQPDLIGSSSMNSFLGFSTQFDENGKISRAKIHAKRAQICAKKCKRAQISKVYQTIFRFRAFCEFLIL